MKVVEKLLLMTLRYKVVIVSMFMWVLPPLVPLRFMCALIKFIFYAFNPVASFVWTLILALEEHHYVRTYQCETCLIHSLPSTINNFFSSCLLDKAGVNLIKEHPSHSSEKCL
ncbi:hypothetical protein IHE45_14G009200 [Dioscorea alata]|nr:hypothetical protein IHE45_14G009200 [Dioscorea alata]